MKYIKRDDNGYVAITSRSGIRCIEKYSANSELITTEVSALKYFASNQFPLSQCGNIFRLPNVPKLISHTKNKIVMEFVRGTPLIEFSNKRMSPSWWRSLLLQLAIIAETFEAQRILHNDFWDSNIILTPISKKLFGENFIVTVIDFQYTNQYTNNAGIHSPTIYSKKPDDMEEKRRLGWSAKFHRGGDLNQILGILSDYRSIPISGLRKMLKNMVIKREGADFPYAITRANPKTAGKKILRELRNLFHMQSA